MQRGKIKISDHALVRYMQRIQKVDMLAVANELLPADTATLAERNGDGEYPTGTHRLVIRNNKVVTIKR